MTLTGPRAWEQTPERHHRPIKRFEWKTHLQSVEVKDQEDRYPTGHKLHCQVPKVQIKKIKNNNQGSELSLQYPYYSEGVSSRRLGSAPLVIRHACPVHRSGRDAGTRRSIHQPVTFAAGGYHVTNFTRWRLSWRSLIQHRDGRYRKEYSNTGSAFQVLVGLSATLTSCVSSCVTCQRLELVPF